MHYAMYSRMHSKMMWSFSEYKEFRLKDLVFMYLLMWPKRGRGQISPESKSCIHCISVGTEKRWSFQEIHIERACIQLFIYSSQKVT